MTKKRMPAVNDADRRRGMLYGQVLANKNGPAGVLDAMVMDRLCGLMRLLPEQRVTREEALAGYTLNAARTTWNLDSCGTLSPGKYVDFIVVDRDLVTCDIDELGQTRVLWTVLGGRSGAMTNFDWTSAVWRYHKPLCRGPIKRRRTCYFASAGCTKCGSEHPEALADFAARRKSESGAQLI